MIPVEGHKHLFRDENTGAIINEDDSGYNNYVKLKNQKLKEKEELDSLRRDIDEIKSLLQNLVRPPT